MSVLYKDEPKYIKINETVSIRIIKYSEECNEWTEKDLVSFDGKVLPFTYGEYIYNDMFIIFYSYKKFKEAGEKEFLIINDIVDLSTFERKIFSKKEQLQLFKQIYFSQPQLKENIEIIGLNRPIRKRVFFELYSQE